MATKQKTAQAETAAASKSKITPLKKLSVKTICGALKIKDFPEPDSEGVHQERMLCRIAGTANGIDRGESTYGAWESLAGEFAATSYDTGEIFVGRAAFIPGAMGDALIAALDSAQREDAAATLKFSVDVSAVISTRDSNKYEYIVRPVIESDVRNEAVALLGLSA
jgi:hypothetical protein